MPRKYTAEWFLSYFESIPAEKWITGSGGWNNTRDRRCVLGHLGSSAEGAGSTVNAATKAYAEAMAPLIGRVAVDPYDINDGLRVRYGESLTFADFGETPKERVVNALVFVMAGLHKEMGAPQC